MTSIYSVIGDAIVAEAKASMLARRSEAAARPIGTEALDLGITDYRRKPDPSIHSRDWAVWLVRWDGKAWKRIRRFGRNLSLDEAHNRLAAEAKRLGVKRV